jgi:hypothetical protein
MFAGVFPCPMSEAMLITSLRIALAVGAALPHGIEHRLPDQIALDHDSIEYAAYVRQ